MSLAGETTYEVVGRLVLETQGTATADRAIASLEARAKAMERAIGPLTGATKRAGSATRSLGQDVSPVTGAMDEVSRAAGRLNQSLGYVPRFAASSSLSFGSLRTSLFGFGRSVLPLIGLTAAGGAAAKVFGSLSEEVERTTQLASQFNIAFQFDQDPLRNFTESMSRARLLVGDIITDAAKLPGTADQFFGAAGLLAGPVFSAGKGPQDLRKLVSQVALGAPFAGVDQETAGRQAYRILTGQASQGDNNLFSQLVPLGLSKDINQLPLAKRFEELDRVLGKVVDNPLFRENVTKTLDVQLSTLSDTIFGAKGIFGRLAGDTSAYDALIGSLQSLNATLQESTPAISGWTRALLDSWDLINPLDEMFGRNGPSEPGKESKYSAAAYGRGRLAYPQARDLMKELGIPVGSGLKLAFQPNERSALTSVSEYLKDLYRSADAGGPGADVVKSAVVRAIFGPDLAGLRQSGELKGGLKSPEQASEVTQRLIRGIQDQYLKLLGDPTEGIPKNNMDVRNYFTIKIDMKSDQSPEGVVVAMRKAIEQEERFRRRSARSPIITPGTSGAR
jgi:hypothetical protein